jgi:hypothetical protein
VRPMVNDDFTLPETFMLASFRKGSSEDRAVETLLKGPEYQLPDGLGSFTDKDGQVRTEIRLAWWKSPPLNLTDASVGVPGGSTLSDRPIPAEAFSGYEKVGDAKATFFGHYWFTGKPEPLAPAIACVDYSVAKKGGQLCCYRWMGERELSSDRFVSVPSSAGKPLP